MIRQTRNCRLATMAAALCFSGPALAQPVGMIANVYRSTVETRLKQSLVKTDLFDDKALRLILCGTSAPFPDAQRAKACAAVIVKGRVFVFDTGPGSVNTLMLMGFPLERIAGVFLTHYHSDHIGDLGELKMQTWAAGRPAPLAVHGPAGVETVVRGFNMAYSLDDSYRTAHHGEGTMPPAAAPLAAQPFSGDGVVYKDADVVITAFTVKHDPIRPAVGYRIDAGGRSIVITGDTAPTESVAKAATGADVLVSEALSMRMMKLLQSAATGAGAERQAKLFGDVQTYHTDPVDAARSANAAGVKLLVLTHLAPGVPQPALEKLFLDGVAEVRDPKGWALGFDGYRVDLPFGGGDPVQGKVPMLGRQN
jgi:ribonuclease Z